MAGIPNRTSDELLDSISKGLVPSVLLVLEGRCRASKSEESGYDSDTRRSLEVLSGRREALSSAV